MVGLLGCKHTLPGHIQLLIYQYLQVLPCSVALKQSTQSVLTLRIAVIRVQDLALVLVELYDAHMGPLLKPVKVPLDGIASHQCISCTTQLGVICKLSGGELNTTLYVIPEDIK